MTTNTNEPEVLKGCPICGPQQRVYLNAPNEHHRYGSINCPVCMIVLPGVCNDQSELIATWNTRVPAAQQEPVAWIAFAENGNIRFWTDSAERAKAERERGLDLRGFTLAELVALSARAPDYDRATTAAQQEPRREDTKLLDALREESWDLRCFDMPTGGGDADIGWRVVGHWQAKPHERTVGEAFEDDPRAAIRDALARTESR